MAIENRVYLKGKIEKYEKIKENGQIVRIAISLLVIRRPNTIPGIKAGELKKDFIKVYVRDESLIKYLEDNHATENDILFVSGVYSTLNVKKIFYCKSCGEKNITDGTCTFVHPIHLDLYELHPKHTEIITVTKQERFMNKDEIIKLLFKRKRFPGNIISIEELKEQDSNGNYLFQITVREEISKEEINNELRRSAEVSNRITIMGNLCADPKYTPANEGGRTCSYQLGIDRKVFIKSDDPEIISDYPWIKSLGDQADSDRDALMEGSLIYVDGSIQAREDFYVERVCENCHTKCKLRGHAMEIVPYAVEYLRNCITSSEEVCDEEFDIEEEMGDEE